VGGPQGGARLRNMNLRCVFISSDLEKSENSVFVCPWKWSNRSHVETAPPWAKTRWRVHGKTWGFPQHAKTTTIRGFCCRWALLLVRLSRPRYAAWRCILYTVAAASPRRRRHPLHAAAVESPTPSGSLRSNPAPQSNGRRCRHHAHKTRAWPRRRQLPPAAGHCGEVVIAQLRELESSLATPCPDGQDRPRASIAFCAAQQIGPSNCDAQVNAPATIRTTLSTRNSISNVGRSRSSAQGYQVLSQGYSGSLA
jgi:hypothetical protein